MAFRNYQEAAASQGWGRVVEAEVRSGCWANTFLYCERTQQGILACFQINLSCLRVATHLLKEKRGHEGTAFLRRPDEMQDLTKAKSARAKQKSFEMFEACCDRRRSAVSKYVCCFIPEQVPCFVHSCVQKAMFLRAHEEG
jgi:hypothetical protein